MNTCPPHTAVRECIHNVCGHSAPQQTFLCPQGLVTGVSAGPCGCLSSVELTERRKKWQRVSVPVHIHDTVFPSNGFVTHRLLHSPVQNVGRPQADGHMHHNVCVQIRSSHDAAGVHYYPHLFVCDQGWHQLPRPARAPAVRVHKRGTVSGGLHRGVPLHCCSILFHKRDTRGNRTPTP